MSIRLVVAISVALSSTLSVAAFSRMVRSRYRYAPVLHTTTSTPADYELPEDAPKHNNDDASPSRLPSELEATLSDARRERFEMEAEAEQRFLLGDELHALRQKVLEFRGELKAARAACAAGRVHGLEQAILKAQQADPEFVYSVSKERMAVAQEAGLHEEADMWRKELEMSRSVLPQFGLSGLWVGKYSENGFEMINVTYAGPDRDILVAYKVTGQKHVPKGEVTFQVDLNESHMGETGKLEPIELGERASKQWGSRFLHRFAGKGQVSAEGFRNSQWMEGHLILVNEYFSFAWLPIGHQVFFGRPSPQLTLQLINDQECNNSSSDRCFLARCLEETEAIEDELEIEEDAFLWHGQQDYNQPGCFE